MAPVVLHTPGEATALFSDTEFNREAELWILIQRCFRKNPERRPSSWQVEKNIADLIEEPFRKRADSLQDSGYVDLHGARLESKEFDDVPESKVSDVALTAKKLPRLESVQISRPASVAPGEGERQKAFSRAISGAYFPNREVTLVENFPVEGPSAL